MKETNVKEAVSEAKRFISRAAIWLHLEDRYKETCGTKEGGALRRASMDLTRALANLRKY